MKKPTILCVDDEQIVLTSLIGQLNNFLGPQFNYEGFTDAGEALEFLQEVQIEGSIPSLIISDWLMPKMRGDEFLIKVHKQYPAIQLIMLSGQADEECIVRAKKEANLFKFVSKPWDKNELIGDIKRALETNS